MFSLYEDPAYNVLPDIYHNIIIYRLHDEHATVLPIHTERKQHTHSDLDIWAISEQKIELTLKCAQQLKSFQKATFGYASWSICMSL